jgi:signal transduction histidine kinase/ActR/RegA family two-component response regulator
MTTMLAPKGVHDPRPFSGREWRAGTSVARWLLLSLAAGFAARVIHDPRLLLATGAVAGLLLYLAPRATHGFRRISGAGANAGAPTRDQQLEELRRLEAVGQLAGGVAHDFNNILTVIGIHSEFLLAGLDPSEPHHTDAREIHEATQRASMLTKQLLAFSRRQVLEMTPVSVNDVIHNMVPMLRRLIGEDIDIQTRLDPDIGIALSDAGQMQQIVMNLAVNARDAMPGGGTITITTAEAELDRSYGLDQDAVPPGRYAMLAVSDTGCGMTPDVRARIFEPFFTTKPPGIGTGLGLATVFGIVRQSGGHISVHSEVGHGTSFKVYLPLAAGQVYPTPDADLPRGAQGTETILLVEDEPNVREAARRILAQHGYDVVEAASGPEAVAVAERMDRDVALLLTDIVLPDAHGPRVVDRITTHHPHACVLYMSGYTDTDIARRGLGRAAGTLQKPFSSRTLLRAVRLALDGRTPSLTPQPAVRIAS